MCILFISFFPLDFGSTFSVYFLFSWVFNKWEEWLTGWLVGREEAEG